jgi:hypothetical protein
MHKQIQTYYRHIIFNIKGEKNHTSLGKKQTYFKCKSFCQSLTTINLSPPTKLQPIGQCRGRGNTNHIGGKQHNEHQQLATTQ